MNSAEISVAPVRASVTSLSHPREPGRMPASSCAPASRSTFLRPAAFVGDLGVKTVLRASRTLRITLPARFQAGPPLHSLAESAKAATISLSAAREDAFRCARQAVCILE